MKICSACVLPESTPQIAFDENGVCNYCRSYSKFKYKGEKKLREVLDSHRRPNSQYDCMVPVSGGRDSTYTLLKLVREYKMKVLAVNYDNPFTDPLAKTNMDKAMEKLNVDLIRFKLKNNLHEKSFRSLLKAWYRRPNPALVPIMCSACHLMWLHMLRIAKQNDIHLLVSGNDPFEETAFKVRMVGGSETDDVESNFTSTIFGIVKEAIKNPTYLNPACMPVMIMGYLFGNHKAIGSKVYGYNVDKIELFSYIEWKEKEILSTIQKELNWASNRKFAGTWRFDCKATCLKDFMYMKTIGMTERDDLYAKQVREGLITRGKALEKLKKENALYPDEIHRMLHRIGMRDTSFINKI
jgi:hypothetical protein